MRQTHQNAQKEGLKKVGSQRSQLKYKQPMQTTNIVSRARQALVETIPLEKRKQGVPPNDEIETFKGNIKKVISRAQSAALGEQKKRDNDENKLKNIGSPNMIKMKQEVSVPILEFTSPKMDKQFRINLIRHTSQAQRQKLQQLQAPQQENHQQQKKMQMMKRRTRPPSTKVQSITAMDLDSVKLGELIGEGAYGKVYRGFLLQGRFVAVKQITKSKMVDNLVDEIKLLQKLQNPYIVKYYGCKQDENFLNIYLEYMSGGSIAERLKQYGRFTETLTKKFVIQVLNGLIYLHSQGVVHRDLKGGNILSDEKGNVKLADFGSSKIMQDLQNNSQSEFCTSMKGSLYWMAPELLQQKAHGRRIDIWSLGCTIIEMVTGQHPWQKCTSIPELICQVVTQKCPPIPSQLSQDCQEFIKACCTYEKKDRPRAAQLKELYWLKQQ